MRTVTLTVFMALAVAVDAASQSAPASIAQPATAARAPAAAAPRPIGTMSELMVHLIRPTSDAVFYITSRTPATEEAWGTLQAQTLLLAEAGHLLLMPSRARGRTQWVTDATLMLEVGRKAFAAATAKDVAALEALNDELYQSCVTCHQHFRPGYGTRPPR